MLVGEAVRTKRSAPGTKLRLMIEISGRYQPNQNDVKLLDSHINTSISFSTKLAISAFFSLYGHGCSA